MNWHLIVRAEISQAIGNCGLSRQGLVRVYARLYGELPTRADQLRRRRDPADPDYFLYRFALRDAGVWHTLSFRIDDVSAPPYLFIKEVKHSI